MRLHCHNNCHVFMCNNQNGADKSDMEKSALHCWHGVALLGADSICYNGEFLQMLTFPVEGVPSILSLYFEMAFKSKSIEAIFNL